MTKDLVPAAQSDAYREVSCVECETPLVMGPFRFPKVTVYTQLEPGVPRCRECFDAVVLGELTSSVPGSILRAYVEAERAYRYAKTPPEEFEAAEVIRGLQAQAAEAMEAFRLRNRGRIYPLPWAPPAINQIP